MKEIIFEDNVKELPKLKIEEGKTHDVCKVGKKTKFSCRMSQHLTRVSELSLMGFMRLIQGVVIEGKVTGQARGPPINEQDIVVQKKKIKQISDYGIVLPIGVLSHDFGILYIQKHDFGYLEMITIIPASLNQTLKLKCNTHGP